MHAAIGPLHFAVNFAVDHWICRSAHLRKHIFR
jgi:hypothetical protein